MGSTGSPSMTGLIADSYVTGDNPTPPNVQVTAFSIVCQSASKNANMWRAVSVVVEYTCDVGCEDTTVLSQFDLTCIGGQWRLNVLGFTSSGALRTTPANASLVTPRRTDCSICFSPELGAHVGLISSVDPVTHCAGMNAAWTITIPL